MVNLRLRRTGLPIAVSAAVAAALLVPSAAGATATIDSPVASAPIKSSLAATDETKFGDLTGDGKADLAAIDSSGTMWVYPGKRYVYSGTGTRSTSLFDARIKVGAGWSKFTSLVRHGDFNGDGKQDILARDAAGKLFFYAGTGNPSGMFKAGTQAGTGWGNFTSITGAGDLNWDGKDDLLGQQTDGKLALYTGTNNPAAPFSAKGTVVGTGWKGSLLTAMGDWTFDFRTEFLFRNTAGVVSQYWSRAGVNPIGSREAVITDPVAGNSIQNIVGTGDLTSDADFVALPDTLYQHKDGALVLYSADVSLDTPKTALIIGKGWGSYRIF